MQQTVEVVLHQLEKRKEMSVCIAGKTQSKNFFSPELYVWLEEVENDSPR